MTASPSDPQSAGSESTPANADLVPIALTFEDRLQLIWRRHRTMIIAICLGVALAIIGLGLYDYVEAKREAGIEREYAAAGSPEALRAFATAHPDHNLAGVSSLRLADEAFTAGKYPEALTSYENAGKIFKAGPLAARTKLGIAITKIMAGKPAEGVVELRQIAEDLNQFAGIRAEAAYHLASLAAEAGTAVEVQKYSDLLLQIDPSSPWTQRAIMLRASFPPTAESAGETAASVPAAPSAPAIQFTPTAK